MKLVCCFKKTDRPRRKNIHAANKNTLNEHSCTNAKNLFPGFYVFSCVSLFIYAFKKFPLIFKLCHKQQFAQHDKLLVVVFE